MDPYRSIALQLISDPQSKVVQGASTLSGLDWALCGPSSAAKNVLLSKMELGESDFKSEFDQHSDLTSK